MNRAVAPRTQYLAIEQRSIPPIADVMQLERVLHLTDFAAVLRPKQRLPPDLLTEFPSHVEPPGVY
jgi:hypothetical protein